MDGRTALWCSDVVIDGRGVNQETKEAETLLDGRQDSALVFRCCH